MLLTVVELVQLTVLGLVQKPPQNLLDSGEVGGKICFANRQVVSITDGAGKEMPAYRLPCMDISTFSFGAFPCQ